MCMGCSEAEKYGRGAQMRVAVAHFWLLFWRGAERVLDQIVKLYPGAEMFTLFHDARVSSEHFPGMSVHSSFLDRLPGARRHYTKLFPLYPLGVKSLRVPAGRFDLVISSEDGPIKGIKIPAGTPHVCYCHSPMRYVWGMTDVYAGFVPFILRPLFRLFIALLRWYDRSTINSPDVYIANSEFVAGRIRKYYGKEPVVIHPPVDVAHYSSFLERRKSSDKSYYLWFGALITYKRPDLAVEAFNRSSRELLIIGDGELAESLKKRAAGNIKFAGFVPDDELPEYLLGARALIFPGEEDFGIIPVEVMAMGIPVIAYGAGGALETVPYDENDIASSSGIHFHEQTPEALNRAIEKFESVESQFDPELISERTERFAPEVFRAKFQSVVDRAMCAYKTAGE
jgi:glycosyltransferase involved in cell wall biosynthesis